MQRDYIFGTYPEQGRRAGRRIAWRNSPSNVYYYFADAIGSTRAVTNATGTKCFDTDYYPYGQENDYNTSCSVEFKFTGYEYDSETGNYYAYARYYDPRLGRFMSPDPLGGSIQNPQSLNRYTYVLNNPESFTDPTGNLCELPNGSVQDISNSQCQSDGGSVLAVVTTVTVTTTKGTISEDCGGGVCPLPADYLFFLSEATGPNACLLWCAPTPPPDAFLAPLAQKLEKRLRALRKRFRTPQTQAPQHIGTPKTSSQCSIYLQSGTTSGSVLNFICREAPNGPRSQQMRGCLQAAYSPKSGHFPFPFDVMILPGGLINLNDVIPGSGAHAVCAADAFGIR